MSSQRVKRQRVEEKAVVGGVKKGGISRFFNQYSGVLSSLFESLVELIDQSDLPLFRHDVDDNTLEEFVAAVYNGFANKVRVVADDAASSTQSFSSDDEEELSSDETSESSLESTLLDSDSSSASSELDSGPDPYGEDKSEESALSDSK